MAASRKALATAEHFSVLIGVKVNVLLAKTTRVLASLSSVMMNLAGA